MAKKIPIKILKWRRKQPRGAIMKPATFEKIKKQAMKKYRVGEERAKKIAGKAYWTSVRASARARGYERRV